MSLLSNFIDKSSEYKFTLDFRNTKKKCKQMFLALARLKQLMQDQSVKEITITINDETFKINKDYYTNLYPILEENSKVIIKQKDISDPATPCCESSK